MRKTEAGFTLLEVMVAMAIMATISAIAVPNIIGWLPGYRLRSAVGDIRSNLQLARSRAIKENRSYEVVFNTGGTTYDIKDGTGNTVKTVDLNSYGSGIRYVVSLVTYPNDKVVFNPAGLNTPNGYVTIQNNRGDQARSGTPTIAGVIVCENL